MAEESISLAEERWRRCSPPGRFAFTREGWERYKRLAEALIASISLAEAALSANTLSAGERAVIALRLKAASIVLGNPGPFARVLGDQG